MCTFKVQSTLVVGHLSTDFRVVTVKKFLEFFILRKYKG